MASSIYDNSRNKYKVKVHKPHTNNGEELLTDSCLMLVWRITGGVGELGLDAEAGPLWLVPVVLQVCLVIYEAFSNDCQVVYLQVVV